ncbi:hypothetical protein FZW96_08145 [Bacillus sp. BGMRC 2118]|nr:hypothetical protein FZW96_08145 [Bacillus sp. BGMRC 2118]
MTNMSKEGGLSLRITMKSKFSSLLIFVFLLSMLASPFSSAAQSGEQKPSLVALGDSITYGWNLDQDRTKPSTHAFPYLIGDGYFQVNNLSYPGWTSENLLTAFETNPAYGQAIADADMITLSIGSNDLLQAANLSELLASGKPITDPAELLALQQKVAAASLKLSENLQTIIGFIRVQNPDAPIVFYNIYNPFGPSTDQFAGFVHSIGEQIVNGVNASVITPVAEGSQSILVDAYTAFNGKQASYILPNDIHPTVEGQQVLANIASDAILPLLPQEWKLVDGNWMYKHGWNLKKGWLHDKGAWYYLDKSTGIMQTGWELVDGNWYYLNQSGAMKTGWYKENSTWYHLSASGAMSKGWLWKDNQWYYFGKSGAMKTGWYEENGTWYYLNTSGEMAKGWKLVGKTWYYFYSNGKMAHDTTIEGYKINSLGVWVK